MLFKKYGRKLSLNQGKLESFVKFLSLSTDFQKHLGGHLAPSSHCSILIETPLVSEADQENDLSITPILLEIIDIYDNDYRSIIDIDFHETFCTPNFENKRLCSHL
jgi:hypothetical protein